MKYVVYGIIIFFALRALATHAYERGREDYPVNLE